MTARPAVLIVEDSVRHAMSVQLALAWCETYLAQSVDTALEMLAHRRSAMIICDWHLGPRTGAEVLAAAVEPCPVFNALLFEVQLDEVAHKQRRERVAHEEPVDVVCRGGLGVDQ